MPMVIAKILTGDITSQIYYHVKAVHLLQATAVSRIQSYKQKYCEKLE